MTLDLAISSTSLTGSDPGDRIKNMGVLGSASSIELAKISRNEIFESKSTN